MAVLNRAGQQADLRALLRSPDITNTGTSGNALLRTTCGTCTAPHLLGAKATAAISLLAAGLGFAAPNPYCAGATYYASNSVYQYYMPYPQFSGVSDTTSYVGIRTTRRCS